MNWVYPLHSRTKVNSAGELLRKKISSASMKELLEAVRIVDNWRLSHAYPINTFQASLRNFVKPIDPSANVSQRLKRRWTIIRKLERFPTMQLSQIHDIAGCRCVVSNIEHVRQLRLAYDRSRMLHVRKRTDDYITNPKADGYRGLHLIYVYKSNRSDKYDNLLVEIQIRTKLQHIWATAVEIHDIFTQHKIKLGSKDEEWNEFFANLSSIFAGMEAHPAVPGTPEGENLIKRFKELEKKLRVRSKLGHWAVALEIPKHLKNIEKSKDYYYFLLELNMSSKEKRLAVLPYKRSQLKDASNKLSEIESKQNGDIDAVLVSVRGLNDLKKAYPNYFLDTRQLIKVLDHILGPEN